MDKYPYYDNALGCIVKNKYDKSDKIKRLEEKHGVKLEEVGNEPLENIHKDHDRWAKENHERIWKDADKNLQEIL